MSILGVLAKPVITAAAKEGAKLCLNRYREHEAARIEEMFAQVGLELELGDSAEAWEELLGKIDDPKVHAAVIEGARKAADSFDEAPIPYIARVVSSVVHKESTTIDDRRLIRLLAECDRETLETLMHMVCNLAQAVEKAEKPFDTLRLKLIPGTSAINGLVEAWVNSSANPVWHRDKLNYELVFEILKRNYWATDSSSGTAGSESGPHILLINKEKLLILRKILRG